MTEFIVLKIKVFRLKVNIVVCDNFKEAAELVNKKYKLRIGLDDIEDSGTHARCYCCNMPIIFYKRKYLNINTIVHEMIHAVRCMLESARDMPLTDSSEEAYAYMLGYCVNEFFKQYNILQKAEFLLKRLLE